MVKVFNNWLYGMFALLGPVMLVGNAIESRRRGRKTTRRNRIRYADDIAEFGAELTELAAAERRLRVERLPAPPEIVRRATAPSTRLWERRPNHDDFLVLRAGVGTMSWDPPVAGQPRTFAAEVRQAISAASRLPLTPVDVDLTAGGVVGIFGSRPAALGVARSLVAQAATLHGPADLPVAVLTAQDRSPDWDWAKWLPHTADRSGSGQRMLAAEPELADRLLRDLLARQPTGDDDGPTLLVVIDDESLTEGRRSPARSLLVGGPTGRRHRRGRIRGPPAGVVHDRRRAHRRDGEAVVHRPATGRRIDEVLVRGMADHTVRTVARALARFDDPELDVAGAGLPSAVGLLPLLGLDPPTPDEIVRRWAAAGADPDLVAPIGVAEDGVAGARPGARRSARPRRRHHRRGQERAAAQPGRRSRRRRARPTTSPSC